MSDMVITARASSLPAAADCPARWKAQQIDGLKTPPSPRSALGNAIHASTAVHDQRVIDAEPLRADESAGVAVDYLREHAAEIDWAADENLKPRQAEAIALSLHGRYCSEIAPTRIYSACEVDLGALEIDTGEGVIVRLTGHGDRIREEDDTEIVSDVKSGKTVVAPTGRVDTKKYAFQTAAYKLLRRASTGRAMSRKTEIIGLQTGITPATQRVGVGIAEDVEETLLGTSERPGLLHSLALWAKTDSFHGNPWSPLCGEKFCPIYHNCHFRK